MGGGRSGRRGARGRHAAVGERGPGLCTLSATQMATMLAPGAPSSPSPAHKPFSGTWLLTCQDRLLSGKKRTRHLPTLSHHTLAHPVRKSASATAASGGDLSFSHAGFVTICYFGAKKEGFLFLPVGLLPC